MGFANTKAQYRADVNPDGSFTTDGMVPGTYNLKVYKNELEVAFSTVTVSAGEVTRLDPIVVTNDPAASTPLWRIGAWDGSPQEFKNGDKVTTMHPVDVRMSPWVTPEYDVLTSTAATGFPAYQWKDVNNSTTICFNLRKSQIRNYTLRVGTTVAFAGLRPRPQVNGWLAAIPAAPNQPKTRTLTVGTYRGNNNLYVVNIPASELVVGQNTITLTGVSGSGGTSFLSPGYAYDAVDLIPTP